MYGFNVARVAIIIFYACLELISFSRSFEDKLTISSQIVFQINNICRVAFIWLCYKVFFYIFVNVKNSHKMRNYFVLINPQRNK